MTAALLAYLTGLILTVGFGTAICQCGCNTEPTPCPPCDPICNQGPPVCSKRACIIGQTFCRCIPGYYRPTPTSNFCIPPNECPPKCIP